MSANSTFSNKAKVHRSQFETYSSTLNLITYKND